MTTCANRVEVPYDFDKCKQTKALFFDGIECENKWEWDRNFPKLSLVLDGVNKTSDIVWNCPFFDRIEFIPDKSYGMECRTTGVRWKIDESDKYAGQVQEVAIKVICDSINEYLQKKKATFFILRELKICAENDTEEKLICRFWHGNLKGEEKC